MAGKDEGGMPAPVAARVGPTGPARLRHRPRQQPRWLAATLIVAVLAGAVPLLPRAISLFAVAERLVDDFRIAFFAPAEPQNTDIVIIAVTEDTLAALPYRSPLDRDFVAGLVAHLDRAGATAIGIDLLFDQATEPEKDTGLAAVLDAASVPVVLATAIEPYPLTQRQRDYIDHYAPTVPRGFVNLLTEGIDKSVRRFVSERNGVLSFPAELARQLGHGVPDGPQTIAWHGQPDAATRPFAIYPAHAAALLPTDWIAGRVALIGPVLPSGGGDRHNTPLAWRDGPIPGVVIHAHVLAQLLDGRRPPQAGVTITAALGAVLALAGIGLARARWAWPLKVLGGLAVVAAVWAASTLWFQAGGPLVPVVLASFGLPAAAGMDAAVTGRRLREQRRFIRDAFTLFVSPSVVARLERDPGRLTLTGERRECTFLFTDLTGFTTLSESLAPEALAELLNAYLNGMTKVILAHDGTLDKFVGDAVVAFFGAPETQPDHARRAVACARDLDVFARDFAAGQAAIGRPLGRTRIGVHSGIATVGNFGGSQRFQYTAMGDVVNTAARLEAANKALGTTICISSATVRQCPDEAVRPVGELMLPGKTQPIMAYTPVRHGEAPGDEAYRRAFARLAGGQESAEALIGAFQALADGAPDDPLPRFQLHRLQRGETGIRIVLTGK